MPQHPQTDYFSFFGLPVALSIDGQALRQAYLRHSKLYHPDFHTLADAEAQAQALAMSSFNNEAFKTLSDPDKRLQYVLQMKGLLPESGNEEKLPQDFLMEVMELNEALMELEFEPDITLYERLQQQTATIENNLLTKVTPILEQWTEESGSESDLILVREYFLKKRYLLRIKENLSKFAAAFE